MWEDYLYTASVWALPLLLGITLHEAAHGYAADALGDPTPRMAGRLTLNPIRHIDLFGTIIMPVVLLVTTGIMFGSAKPVPVNPRYFRSPRRDFALVAAAGPAANLVLALTAAFLLHAVPFLPDSLDDWGRDVLIFMMWSNITFALFNLLPLPALDGSRVAIGILPLPLARGLAALERHGLLIVIGLFVVVPMLARQAGTSFEPARLLLEGPSRFIFRLMLQAAGLV